MQSTSSESAKEINHQLSSGKTCQASCRPKITPSVRFLASSPAKTVSWNHQEKMVERWLCVWTQRSIAWRVLDAQYFGVAQRRRRVFVVASARTDFDPTKVLFELEGVRRDTAPSRSAGSVAAALTANGVGTCGADDNQALPGTSLQPSEAETAADLSKLPPASQPEASA